MAELNQATTQMDDLTRLAAVLGSMANGALRILNARSN